MNWCFIMGHKLVDIDTKNYTAMCSRCNKRFEVSYDMLHGCTYVVQELEPLKKVCRGKTYYPNRRSAERMRRKGDRVYYVANLGYYLVRPIKRNIWGL